MRRGEDQVGRHEAAAAKELRTLKERDQERVVVGAGLRAADDARPRLVSEVKGQAAGDGREAESPQHEVRPRHSLQGVPRFHY